MRISTIPQEFMHADTKETVLKNVATLGFIGHIPYAPGTFGSLCGIFVIYILNLSAVQHGIFLAVGFMVGIKASTAAEKLLQDKDSGKIVIDEFIGIGVTTFAVPHSALLYGMAFILFRFFDIIKPLPINKLEKTLSGGLGVMADDVLAGIYANIFLQLWIKIF